MVSSRKQAGSVLTTQDEKRLDLGIQIVDLTRSLKCFTEDNQSYAMQPAPNVEN